MIATEESTTVLNLRTLANLDDGRLAAEAQAARAEDYVKRLKAIDEAEIPAQRAAGQDARAKILTKEAAEYKQARPSSRSSCHLKSYGRALRVSGA